MSGRYRGFVPWAAAARRHYVFLAMFAVGALLRTAVLVMYRPALTLFGDSFSYVTDAKRLTPGAFHPLGYPLFLRPLLETGTTITIPIVQHLLGLAVALTAYAVLVRAGVRPWLAALGVAPILLDAWQLVLEQFVLSETVAEALLLAAFLLLLRRPQERVGVVRAAVVGLLVAAATVTRTVSAFAVPAIVVVVLVEAGPAWRRRVLAGAAAAVAFAAPTLAYAGWYDATNGRFALSGYDGHWLYGRVATFARCTPGSDATARNGLLCPREPANRRYVTNYYTWNGNSQSYALARRPGSEPDEQALRWSLGVIEHQPLPYLRLVARDSLLYFDAHRRDHRDSYPQSTWHLGEKVARWGLRATVTSPSTYRIEPNLRRPRSLHQVGGPAALVSFYSRWGYPPGPLVAAVGLLGLAPLFRRRTRSTPAALVGAAMGVTSLVAIVVAAMTVTLDYRYFVGSELLLVLGGALGAEVLLQGRERSADTATAAST